MLPSMLDKLTEESLRIALETESNCGHTSPGSIQETVKSIAVAEALGRDTLVITPHHDFSSQLNEIIQMLVLLII